METAIPGVKNRSLQQNGNRTPFLSDFYRFSPVAPDRHFLIRLFQFTCRHFCDSINRKEVRSWQVEH